MPDPEETAMTRYQLPDTPSDRRRAARAPLVAGSLVAALISGAMLFHRDGGSGPIDQRPVAVLSVPQPPVPARMLEVQAPAFPEPASLDFGLRP
jgi:hypothetical protein